MAHSTLNRIGLLALPMLISTSLDAATFSDPVGVVKITIAAAPSSNQASFSFLSTSMSREAVYQGSVSSGGSGTITIGSDDWTTNQFNTSPHYVMIASGPREGELLDIASNTSNTLTLEVNENQSDLATHTIRIHKHNTIASIFGSDPAINTVQKGDRSTADHIQLFNPSTAVYSTYYFNTATNPLPVGGVFHQGWVNTSDLTSDAANTPIYPDDGFIYKRVVTTSFEVAVNGHVITNQIKVPLINGYNLVTIPYPVDKSITLETSALRPANPVDFDINIHLVAGNRESADQVLIYNSISKQYETYYYNDATNSLPVGGVFHQGWVNATDLTTDAKTTTIPSGAGIFILRKSGRPAFNWTFANIAP